MFGFGYWEFLIILVVMLLLFGNRLPSLARSLGQSLIEFKKGVKEIDEKKPEENQEASHS